MLYLLVSPQFRTENRYALFLELLDVNHVALVRQVRGAEMPESFWTDPLMYQGGSDSFSGPATRLSLPMRPMASISKARSRSSPVTSRSIRRDARRKAQGARRKAQDAIRLIVLVNDISLRHVIAGEIAKGFGFLQGKPSSTLSPVGTDLTCAG